MQIETFYRFRPVESLLDRYEELEKQTIFFAPPHKLNDPIEGFKDIYWEGDEILWKNLFNKYLLCLFDGVIEFKLNGEDTDITATINAAKSPSQLSDHFLPIFQSISDDFFGSKYINEMIIGITNYRSKVSSTELSFYLNAVHGYALQCISQNWKGIVYTRGNTNAGASHLEAFNWTEFFEQVSRLEDEHGEVEVRGFLSKLTFSLWQTSFLAYKQGINSKVQSQLKRNFAELFIVKLEKLMFPDWFTACFMNECENSSVWGSYGNNHTGVCLLFNAEVNEGHECLTLDNAIKGSSINRGRIKGKSPFIFYKIDYDHTHKPLNFFEYLGQLPVPVAYDDWFSWYDQSSQIALDYSDKWRKCYWDNFYSSVTRKTKDWAYEKEYRLLICNMMGSYSEGDTTLRYDFKSLKGIIFGIKTTDENKLRIIEIVERKIRENDHYEFKFYQAYYCRDDGKIKHHEMTYLRFDKPES